MAAEFVGRSLLGGGWLGMKADVAMPTGLRGLFAKVLQEGDAATGLGCDIVYNGFETLKGLLFEEGIVALGEGQMLNIDAGGGENDLRFGRFGLVVDDFQCVHVMEHMGDLLFAKVEPASQGTFGDRGEVGEESAVHAEHKGEQVGVARLL